ncbi:hypothetical protein CL621_01620 [archaeon]|nr:hypothetical protein [archaeon]|tara:strand:+ start:554 stop:907 length:354 start_codon:yes stop_codon:yes gene_type:complete
MRLTKWRGLKETPLDDIVREKRKKVKFSGTPTRFSFEPGRFLESDSLTILFSNDERTHTIPCVLNTMESRHTKIVARDYLTIARDKEDSIEVGGYYDWGDSFFTVEYLKVYDWDTKL